MGIDLVISGWIEAIFTVVGVFLAIFIPLYQQMKIEKEGRKSSYEAILTEIEENNRTLKSEEYEKLEYDGKDESSGKNFSARFTNAYLDAEAYHSILYSGSFTKLSAKTQHTLTHLYSRIKSHNELLTYRDHFQDLFFTFNDDSEYTRKKWGKNITRYDALLTILEEEITKYLNEANNLLQIEKSHV